MRYIAVPSPFEVKDLDDKPTGEIVSFYKFVSTLCAVAANKGSADTLTLIDIRADAKTLQCGNTWGIADEWHKILADEAKKVAGVSPISALSAESHIRSILEASSKKPVVLKDEPTAHVDGVS